jgi:hypothetical protein
VTAWWITRFAKQAIPTEVPWYPHPQSNLFDTSSLSRHIVDNAIESYIKVEPGSIAQMFHRWTVLAASAPQQGNSGVESEMRKILSDDGFRHRFPRSPSLFFMSPSGWQVRMKSTRLSQTFWQGEAHVDQFLATCAEIGIPLQQAVETKEGTTSIEQLLKSSRLECVRDQEIEWSAVAYCSYLPEQPVWTNRFGEQLSYDQVAYDLLAKTPGTGACYGTHTLIALTHILLADDRFRIIDGNTRRHIEARLHDTSRLLMQSQLACGGWPTSWYKSETGSIESLEASRTPSELLHVTGHHLEWIITAPQNLRPDERTISDAVRFLLKAVDGQDSEDIRKNYCGFSHALRVLLLLERENMGK